MRDIVDRLVDIKFCVTPKFRRLINDTLDELARLRAETTESYIDWDRRKLIVVTSTLTTVVPLPIREYKLLKCLCATPNRLVPWERLIFTIWGDDPNGGPSDAKSNLKVYLHSIRKKIPWHITTYPGEDGGWAIEGYKSFKQHSNIPYNAVAGITKAQLMAGR